MFELNTSKQCQNQTSPTLIPFELVLSTDLEPMLPVVLTLLLFYCLQLVLKFTSTVKQMCWKSSTAKKKESSLLPISANADASPCLHFLYFRIFAIMELTDLDLHARWKKNISALQLESDRKNVIASTQPPPVSSQKYVPVWAMIWGMYHTPVNRQHCTEGL